MSQENSPLLSTTISTNSKGEVVLSVVVHRDVRALQETTTTDDLGLLEGYSVTDAITDYLVAVTKMLNYIAEPQYILTIPQQKHG